MELHTASLWEAISDAVPERPALVQGDKRRTWRQFEERAARLASALAGHGIGAGDTVGLLLHNCSEFLEAYFAILKVRAVPFNVNFRYTATEISYLLTDADAGALVYHACFSEVVERAVADASVTPVLVEVEDGGPPLPGTLRFEDEIERTAPAERIVRNGDDITMTYTGGTTGMPKGVVSKIGPAVKALLETVPALLGRPPTTIDEAPAFAASIGDDERLVSLPASPLIHATGLAIGAIPSLATGGTVVLLDGRHFDPDELWDTVAREQVNAITIVGDPFARPMLKALDANPSRDLSRVRAISSSGAMFSAEIKTGLLGHLPGLMILDFIASTEGAMGLSVSNAAMPPETARFHPGAGVIVIDEDGRRLEPGSGQPGLVALPGGAEGYHGDPVKTAATFRMIGGERYTVPGDFAILEADGSLKLLGRGSGCINTAGEKVYAEEVEEVLKSVGSVEDALVFGVDDERYGQKVVAVIARANGSADTVDAILHAARGQLAGYKVPREVAVVDLVPRTPVGKPDYPTARHLFAQADQPPVT
jgi:acyl-CoA synthetase (AMP-forming)/AMP-acid ligase II